MKYHIKIKYTILILAVLFATLFSTVQVEAAGSKTVEGTSNYDYAYEVLALVNKERSKAGAGSLTMDKELLDAAMMRAAECTVSFSHSRPNGTSCFAICDKMYAENIAYGYDTPEAVMRGWMGSAGHRMNILNSSYNSVGIGCFYKNGSKYWVQCFGYASAESVSNPGNCKSTYQVSLTDAEETKLVKTEGTAKSSGNPLKTKVSGLKVKAGKKKLTITWKKKKNIDGYRLQISKDKAFKSSQTYMVKAGVTQKTIAKYKGKRLQSGKKYYIRICAYVKNTGEDGKTGNRYSKWQSAGKKTK